MGYPQGVWKIENQFVFIANINSTIICNCQFLVMLSYNQPTLLVVM